MFPMCSGGLWRLFSLYVVIMLAKRLWCSGRCVASLELFLRFSRLPVLRLFNSLEVNYGEI